MDNAFPMIGGLVAQRIEQLSSEQSVVGSNPTKLTMFGMLEVRFVDNMPEGLFALVPPSFPFCDTKEIVIGRLSD